MLKTRITDMLGIRYPIIKGGMAWCSGAKLASAVSAAGGLGLIGGGSMDPDLFRNQIQKAAGLTDKPIGVNIPLSFKQSPDLVTVAKEEKVPVVFISAGSPKRYTSMFKDNGAKVFHVASTPEQAVKCEKAGVDGVVIEGYEAGGHNGREELTTMVLTAHAAKLLSVPLLAAGGIATGRQLLAALALGADGVQIGSRFAMTAESSAHQKFKDFCVAAKADATLVVLKKKIPVRMMDNPFRERIIEAEARGASGDELLEILGEGRPRQGMFEGDLTEGILEIGQVAGMLDDLPTCSEVIDKIIAEYESARRVLPPVSA
jgi:enoyl-[acyl-carrier protein] reductase II